MLELKEVLEKRIYQLKQIIQKEERKLLKVPEGTLQNSGTSKRVQFYINESDKRRYANEKDHIPYRFEYPYQLNPYSPVIHPDFTILNVRKRKEYIWEHMGKMDGEGYRDYALNRIIEKTIEHYLK